MPKRTHTELCIDAIVSSGASQHIQKHKLVRLHEEPDTIDLLHPLYNDVMQLQKKQTLATFCPISTHTKFVSDDLSPRIDCSPHAFNLPVYYEVEGGERGAILFDCESVPSLSHVVRECIHADIVTNHKAEEWLKHTMEMVRDDLTLLRHPHTFGITNTKTRVTGFIFAEVIIIKKV